MCASWRLAARRDLKCSAAAIRLRFLPTVLAEGPKRKPGRTNRFEKALVESMDLKNGFKVDVEPPW